MVPPGYFYTPGVGIHKMHGENMSWNDARNTCIREGGEKS